MPVSLRLCQPPIVKGPTVNRDGTTNVSNRVIKFVFEHSTEITNPLKMYNTMAIAWRSKGELEGATNSPVSASVRQQRSEARIPETNTPTTTRNQPGPTTSTGSLLLPVPNTYGQTPLPRGNLFQAAPSWQAANWALRPPQEHNTLTQAAPQDEDQEIFHDSPANL